MVNKDEYIMMT